MNFTRNSSSSTSSPPTSLLQNDTVEMVTSTYSSPDVCNGDWKASFIVTLMVSALSFYCAISLILHEIFLCLRNSRKRTSSGIEERRLARITRVLCILVAFGAMTMSLTNAAILLSESASCFPYPSTEQLCNILNPIRNVGMITTVTATYVFLWFRQRVFYVNPALCEMNKRVLTIFSKAILVVWILYCIAGIVIVVFLTGYAKTVAGCISSRESARLLGNFMTSWLVMCGAMQVSTLGLFIYPLIKRSAFMRNASTRSNRTHSHAVLVGRVKRAIFFSSICVLSDVTAGVLFHRRNAFRISTFRSIYPLDLAINLLCVIGCFDSWPKMMLPCLSLTRRKDRKETTVGSTKTSGSIKRSASKTASVALSTQV